MGKIHMLGGGGSQAGVIFHMLILLCQNAFKAILSMFRIGLQKAGFFVKSPAGWLNFIKTSFNWSKLAVIFSK